MQATKRASKRLSKYMLHTLLRPSTPPTTEMARNEDLDAAHRRQRSEEDHLFAEPNAAEGHVRIDQIPDSELIRLFDPAGPGVTESGYVSARHVGIPIIHIVGMAPSLRPYHTLWRHRYTLEVQLPHNWSALRQRYAWALLPESAVRTGDLDADIRVARELCVLLRLCARILGAVLAADGAGDIVNTVQWVRDEIASVGEDEVRWRGWLEGMVTQRERGWGWGGW
ncbi:hypothetical protein P167DRAFT_546374 [Morchella conica CCBAS932]|uniref:Uncharacterized protein n=1 Tax=Morchella conica CCBAS932 TaxID=1392247 RepID=A0A3N4KPQ9_9PEZI|nr:hypothetical protein P167DRAFT_546374 [Morchella conica CCBAS932]